MCIYIYFFFYKIVVIIMVMLTVSGIFIMVGYFDRSRFYCSSRSLIKSRKEVTPFCVITGK